MAIPRSGNKKTEPSKRRQQALQLPLLGALEAAGGSARPGEVYDRIAVGLGLTPDDANVTRSYSGGKKYNVFHQQVRWARQTAVMQGLLDASPAGVWTLSDAGYRKLNRAPRGAVCRVYKLDGGLALWGHAEDAAAAIEKGTVSLIMLSPPYPGVKRAYGSMDIPQWLAWMKALTSKWKDLLTDDGTLAINLMDRFEPGAACFSPYIERFTLSVVDDIGMNLASRMYWHSPTKLPNLQWSVRERIQPKNTVEQVLLFSKSDRPAWDTRRMPAQNYATRSKSQLAADARRGREVRPSGYDINGAAFERNAQGPIPGNLIIAGGVSGNDEYSRSCKRSGLEPHPARYPLELPRRIITLATDVSEIVYDPMAGSNTTGQVAIELGRRFISSEPILEYVKGSANRFSARPGFEQLL